MEGWSVPVPVPKDTPDGGRSTLDGSGPWVPAVEQGALVAVDAANDEDAVDVRAVGLDTFTMSFLGNAFFFKSFEGVGTPNLYLKSACFCRSALLRIPCMTWASTSQGNQNSNGYGNFRVNTKMGGSCCISAPLPPPLALSRVSPRCCISALRGPCCCISALQGGCAFPCTHHAGHQHRRRLFLRGGVLTPAARSAGHQHTRGPSNAGHQHWDFSHIMRHCSQHTRYIPKALTQQRARCIGATSVGQVLSVMTLPSDLL